MSDPTTPTRPPSLPVALNVLRPGAAQPPRGYAARLGPLALRVYRLGVIAAIVYFVRVHHARLRVDGDAPITPAEVRPFLGGAAKLDADDSERLGLFVLDARGEPIGYVLRTAPLSNKITGYAGPTDTLVVMDAGMRVVGIKIRSSDDTKEHVGNVAADRYFMKLWDGKTWDQVAGMDPTSAGIEGVSGASLTSMAVANGIHHRFEQSARAAAGLPGPQSGAEEVRRAAVFGAAPAVARASRLRFNANDAGLVLVIAAALAFTFTHLRSVTWARRAFQGVLIGYVGLWNGQLIAQSLFAGWAASALPWRVAPGLVLLAAAALALPWTSRRALYCSQLCPHGAAQELLGRLGGRLAPRLSLPRGVERGLRWLPPSLIALVLVVTMLKLPFDLAGIEPFDAYLVRTAGAATIAVAVAGLVAALFVPMAYCKYGCPTGQLLSFVRSHGKADTFGRRDLAAGLMLLLVGALYAGYDPIHRAITGG